MCEAGAKTCPCYGNMTCDAGLSCQPDVQLCIPESCTPGEDSCTCDAGRCGVDLTCADGVCVPSSGGSSGGGDDGGDADSTGSAPSGTDGGIPCSTGVTDERGRCARLVFVSSALVKGDFGGPDPADDLCATLAGDQQLPGSYRAYLQSDEGAAQHVLLDADDLPFVLPPLAAPTLVAENASAFTGGGLEHAISIDETGTPLTASMQCGEGEVAWVGGTMLDCAGWTMTVGNGLAGNVFATAVGEWDGGCPAALCLQTGRVYCFQVPEP